MPNPSYHAMLSAFFILHSLLMRKNRKTLKEVILFLLVTGIDDKFCTVMMANDIEFVTYDGHELSSLFSNF